MSDIDNTAGCVEQALQEREVQARQVQEGEAWLEAKRVVQVCAIKAENELTKFTTKATEAGAWQVAYMTRELLAALDRLDEVEGGNL